MFHLFRLYVINVSSFCFKSIDRVLHRLQRVPVADNGLPQPPGAAAGAPPWFTLLYLLTGLLVSCTYCDYLLAALTA
jgi:hypothetical protein